MSRILLTKHSLMKMQRYYVSTQHGLRLNNIHQKINDSNDKHLYINPNDREIMLEFTKNLSQNTFHNNQV